MTRPVPVARVPVLHGLRDIAALRADAGHEERHVADDLAHLRELARIRRADDEHAVAAGIPALRGQLGDRRDTACAPPTSQILHVPRAGIRRAAQDDDALVLMLQERLERIAAQIGIHRDGIRAIALEGLDARSARRCCRRRRASNRESPERRDSVRWMYSIVRSS